MNQLHESAPPAGTRRGALLRLGGALGAAAGLAACSTAPERANMEARAPAAVKKGDASVAVRVGGGTAGNESAVVADADFKAAIEASLARTGPFAEVKPAAADAQYLLTASIIELRHPVMGFSMTVDMEVAWTLLRQRDATFVLRKALRSTHTAGATEAFAGSTRVRLAVEGAVRKSIEGLLQELAGLAL